MSRLKLAFSPCPNDTFIFDAMVHHKIDTEGIEFDFMMADVEELNHLALQNRMDMTKASYHAWLYLGDRYELLNSGSALGFGNGPLIISAKEYKLEELERRSIAIPGEYTTAHLLLKIAAPKVSNKKTLLFNEIEEAVLQGAVDAGVIIHENRFTYAKKGLKLICDLGEFWEKLTHSPIPLGGILVKKELGTAMIGKLNRIMKRSVLYAMENPGSSMEFVRKNAQEMDEEVIKKHIGLYVNDFTLDLGVEGKAAIQNLMDYTNHLIAGR
jgi:1,4-dihydroxy-6-naphthoate synthase